MKMMTPNEYSTDPSSRRVKTIGAGLALTLVVVAFVAVLQNHGQEVQSSLSPTSTSMGAIDKQVALEEQKYRAPVEVDTLDRKDVSAQLDDGDDMKMKNLEGDGAVHPDATTSKPLDCSAAGKKEAEDSYKTQKDVMDLTCGQMPGSLLCTVQTQLHDGFKTAYEEHKKACAALESGNPHLAEQIWNSATNAVENVASSAINAVASLGQAFVDIMKDLIDVLKFW